jgi:light-regulated signal transduction histidine kinase (bacteriophytochrome)
VLCHTGTGWLAELEPPGADDPPTQVANPLLRRLFQAPTADAEWSGYAAALADAVRRTTGYERVMVYRFLSVTVRAQCVELTQAYALGISAFLAHRRLRRVSGLDADLEGLVDLVLDVTQRRHPTAALERGLLDLFQAGGAALVDAQGINSFGQVPTQREIRAIDDWFIGQPGDEVLATDRLAAESGLTLDLERAAGVLAVRVRPRRAGGPDRRCYWFRPEQARTVRWAGDPNKDAGVDPATAALNPRRSFDLWVETTRGLCAPWDDLNLMAARKLRLLLRRSGLPAGTWL